MKRLDVAGIEGGVWYQFRDPVDGEPMFRDPAEKTKPCKALIRSDQSEAFEKAETAKTRSTRAFLRRAKPDVREKLTDNLAEETMISRFQSLLVSLENCTEDDDGNATVGVVTPSDDDKAAIFADKSTKWMAMQVFGFAGEQANFGVDPTKAGAPDAGAKTKTSPTN